jgi:hypothetical protein
MNTKTKTGERVHGAFQDVCGAKKPATEGLDVERIRS